LLEIKDNGLLYALAIKELNSRFLEMGHVCVSLEHEDEGGIAIFCPGTPDWIVTCVHGIMWKLEAQHQGGKHPITAKLCLMLPRHNRRREKIEPVESLQV